VADLWSDWKTLTCLTKGNKLLVMLKEKKKLGWWGESTPTVFQLRRNPTFYWLRTSMNTGFTL